jgi:glyceraldehyde 3-phosphate dehydrogenase
MKLFINGFGRIGRTVLRQSLQQSGDIVVSGINDIAALDMLAYLFRYDSTFGPFTGDLATEDGHLSIDDLRIPVSRTDDLRALDLAGVDVVLDCTGVARTSDVAARGLSAGARRVLISGPSPAAELTVVLGANDHLLKAQNLVSNASCTTNALAPLIRVLDDAFGLKSGHMTTIHCYTNSQPLVDAPRGDLARSRAAAVSMVPTTTSATHLIDEVLPHLAGRLTGAAVRVPTSSVSAIDLVATLERPYDETVFDTLIAASPVLGQTQEPLVSCDLRGRPESLILARPETRMVGEQLRVFGWYDNEWGFAARMLDIAKRMAA